MLGVTWKIRSWKTGKVPFRPLFVYKSQPLTKAEDDALAFPDKHWESFYKDGIGGAKDPRVALRDKLMLLLMHGGGLRESEAIMLWVTDVFEDPYDPEKAIVRIYNE